MQVDLGNGLATVASPGVSRSALERLDEHVAAAHARITSERDAGTAGYRALDLPETTDLDAIRDVAAPFRDSEVVLTIGIGGSALGAATLTDALGGQVPHRTLDNVDPAHVASLLDRLPLDETVVNVVSRSGTTTETLANFQVVRGAMLDSGVDWTARTVVTTGSDGPIRRLADRNDLPSLPVPTGVPGRFAAFSSVGLFAPAVAGCDLDAIINGAAREAATLSDSLFDCPAYAYGAATAALARRGAAVNAIMPYAEALETFAEWFAQLWAESLGKDGLGQVPARALGATDQHAQLQRYRAGPRNVLVTFVRPRERPNLRVPASDATDLGAVGEMTLGEILDAELDATQASLATAGRPNVRIEIPRLDASGIGELLYGMQAACILVAELDAIDAFNQPAVEWAKRATRDLLADVGSEEARAVADKTTLVV